MSNAKKDVLELIEKRTKRIQELKRKSGKTKTATELIVKFMEDVEPIYNIASGADEFYAMTEICCKALDRHMRILDMGVNMEVDWNNTKDWRELRVTGVRIYWSNRYQQRHNVESEQYIDATALLLQDLDV